MTGCMIYVNAQVIRVNLYIHIGRQYGNDLHASKRRLSAFLIIRRRDAHQTVHSLLRPEHAIRIFSSNGKGRTINANNLSGRCVVNGDLPSTRSAVFQIHVKQHVGPVLSLKSALTWNDGNNSVARVKFLSKPARKLKLGKLRFELLDKIRCFFHKGCIACLICKLERNLRVFKPACNICYSPNGLLGTGKLFHGCTGSLCIIPKISSRAHTFKLGNRLLQSIYV